MMETAVLPPQDCVLRRISPLVDVIYRSGSAPRSRTKLVRASSVQSVIPFLPPEYISPDLGGSSPAVNSFRQSTGRPPTPDRTINTRRVPNSARSVMPTFSKPDHPTPCHPPPCKMRSDAVSLPGNSLSDHMLKVRSLPSRSSSIGPALNRVLHNDSSLSRRSAYSSTGRRPFKLVQGNPVDGRSESKNGPPTSYFEEVVRVTKFLDKTRKIAPRSDGTNCRNISHQNFMDIKKRTHRDFLLRNVDEVDFPIPLRKNEDAKKCGMTLQSEKAGVCQNNCEAEVQPKALPGQIPRVTILQRPKTTEAARELLGRFEWKTETLTPVKVLVNQTLNKEASSLLGEKNNDALVSCLEPGSIARVCLTTCTECVPSHDSTGNEPVCMVAVEQRTSMKDSPYGGDVYLEGDPIGELTCNQVAVDENWAGPAYSISPPPSCLPLPKFSLRQLRTCSLEMPALKEHCAGRGVGDPGLLLPSALSCCQLETIPTCHPVLVEGKNQLDLAFATKDLRRILNLDSC